MCDHKGQEIYRFTTEHGEVIVGGSSGRGTSCVQSTRVLLDLAAHVYKYEEPKPLGFTEDVMKERFNQFFVPAMHKVELKWTDRSIPEVTPEFFPAFVEWVGELITDGTPHLTIACAGGHGRTGTALAALLIHYCNYTVIEAILDLRENYCEEAVESFAQVEWLCAYANKYGKSSTNNAEEVDAFFKARAEAAKAAKKAAEEAAKTPPPLPVTAVIGHV